jgi:hypothetical protein
LRAHDRSNAALAEREARFALARGDWRVARKAVVSYRGERTAELDCCLGAALCRWHADAPASAGYRSGLAALERAAARDPHHTESRLLLAEFEPRVAARLGRFVAAVAADPNEPEALAGHVRETLVRTGDAGFLSLLRPSLEAAIATSRARIEAEADVPRSWLRIARFEMLLGREMGAFDALAHALRLAGDRGAKANLIDIAISEAEAVERASPKGVDATNFVRFLWLARHVLAPTKETARRLRAFATGRVKAPQGPVTMVAGGCDPKLRAYMKRYQPLLARAFDGYTGTLISGGTKEGISGLVAAIGSASRGRIRTIGYLPANLRRDPTAHPDRRFDELRRTRGRDGFSAFEPLQSWIDLVVAGVAPEDVRLLGINGGRISALEYRIAWGLGARVAVVRESGRAVSDIERDIEIDRLPGLLVVPDDAMTLHAFLFAGDGKVEMIDGRKVERLVERLARSAHAKFLEEGRHKIGDPAMVPWESLPEDLRRSNLDQIAYMMHNLARAGLAVVSRGDPRPDAKLAPRIEPMAEMEHGRWNVERLSAGWRLGDRDPEKKRSPYLVGWRELADSVREWDRNAVARFPELIAMIGMRVVDARRARRT